MGPVVYDAKRGWIGSHRGLSYLYGGRLVLKYNIVHLYVIIIIAGVYFPTSYISVCSLWILGEEEPQAHLTHSYGIDADS